MTLISDIRTLISELTLLTRAQVQIIELTRNKAKNKNQDLLDDSDFESDVQMRFLGGGRVPFDSIKNAERDYADLVFDIRNAFECLLDRHLEKINDIASEKNKSITQIESMGKFAKWIEDAQGEFSQLKIPVEDEDGTAYLEFRESWSLYYPRQLKGEVEDVVVSIQRIIDSYTKNQRESISGAIEEMTIASNE